MDSSAYDQDFLTEDTDIDIETEETMDAFCEIIENFGTGVSVLNPEKTKMVLLIFNTLKNQLKRYNVEVNCRLNEPFSNMGCISITGKSPVFYDSTWLSAVAKLASNFNVYPKTNGTVQMDFTFYGLSIPLGNGGESE